MVRFVKPIESLTEPDLRKLCWAFAEENAALKEIVRLFILEQTEALKTMTENIKEVTNGAGTK